MLGVAEPSLAASEPQKEEDEAAEQRMLLEQQVRKSLGVLCLSSLSDTLASKHARVFTRHAHITADDGTAPADTTT